MLIHIITSQLTTCDTLLRFTHSASIQIDSLQKDRRFGVVLLEVKGNSVNIFQSYMFFTLRMLGTFD